MESGGKIDGRHQFQRFSIVRHAPPSEAIPDVAISVDGALCLGPRDPVRSLPVRFRGIPDVR